MARHHRGRRRGGFAGRRPERGYGTRMGYNELGYGERGFGPVPGYDLESWYEVEGEPFDYEGYGRYGPPRRRTRPPAGYRYRTGRGYPAEYEYVEPYGEEYGMESGMAYGEEYEGPYGGEYGPSETFGWGMGRRGRPRAVGRGEEPGRTPMDRWPDIGHDLDQRPRRELVMHDEEIRDAVLENLFQDSWIDPQQIDVDVEDGIVTLTGEVMDFMEARYAWDDAWETAGVRGVVNHLTVRADEPQEGMHLPQTSGERYRR